MKRAINFNQDLSDGLLQIPVPLIPLQTIITYGPIGQWIFVQGRTFLVRDRSYSISEDKDEKKNRCIRCINMANQLSVIPLLRKSEIVSNHKFNQSFIIVLQVQLSKAHYFYQLENIQWIKSYIATTTFISRVNLRCLTSTVTAPSLRA